MSTHGGRDTAEFAEAHGCAILWPPRRAPLIVASYLTGSSRGDAGQDTAHARVARAIVSAMRR